MSEESQTRRLVSPVSGSHTVSQPTDRWAILIGISQYQYEHLNLRYADCDAESLCQLARYKSRKVRISKLTGIIDYYTLESCVSSKQPLGHDIGLTPH